MHATARMDQAAAVGKKLGTGMKYKKIGVVGMGNVGNAVAKNLLKNNFKLVAISDLDRSKLADFPGLREDNPRAVAEKCDIVFTALPLPQHVQAAVTGDKGILEGFAKSSGLKIWIDHSTIDHEVHVQMAREVEAKGGHVVEAPLTGGLEALRKGQMACFLAGQKEVTDAIMPIISKIYQNVQYTGPLGTAMVPKICSDFLVSLNMLAATEVLMLCKKSGVDMKAAFDCIRASSANSFFWETGVPMLLKGEYEPSVSLGMQSRNNQMALDLAAKHAIPMQMLGLAQEIYNQGLEKYGEGANKYMPGQLLEDECSTELRDDRFADWNYSINNLDGSAIIRHHNIDLDN